jgi:hypothetical protein
MLVAILRRHKEEDTNMAELRRDCVHGVAYSGAVRRESLSNSWNTASTIAEEFFQQKESENVTRLMSARNVTCGTVTPLSIVYHLLQR